MPRLNIRAPLAVLAGTVAFAAPAEASWTVTELGPGRALGTFADQQVGYDGTAAAALWRGSADSRVPLHPMGRLSSGAAATSGARQGGGASLNSESGEACLWNGTADSFLSLHPAGAISSSVAAIAGDQQVGSAQFSPQLHAALWTGSAASCIDLHPAGATASVALATSGIRQAGWATIGGHFRAGTWTGTAASWTDLHPPGHAYSEARCLTDTYVAGLARADLATGAHAVLWLGAAGSYTDLHPAGASASEVNGAFGDYQVGSVYVPGGDRAALWNGSASSWTDLAALTPGFALTIATGVWTDGSIIRVSGWGRTSDNAEFALLWSGIVPAPSSLAALGFGAWALVRPRRRAPAPR